MSLWLGSLRVLELAAPGGASFCGRMLADLGAEVIKVEPPGGCATRRRGPFLRGATPPVSLSFLYDNLNKKSVTLDLDLEAGRALFRRLLPRADAVVESMPPGRLEALGLGEAAARRIHPPLVWTSITPFGRTGPKAGWAANDLVAFAAGGVMYISGKPEGPPVVAPDEQAYRIGGFHGAFGTLVALWARRTRTAGQLVEVALQECLAAQENVVTDYARKGEVIERSGSQHKRAVPGRVYPCRDGFVHVMVVHTQAESWERFLDWLGRPAELGDPRFEDSVFRREHAAEVDRVMHAFCGDRTREALCREAQARRIPCAPVNTPAEFAGDAQLTWREFIRAVEGPLGALRMPGLPFKSTDGDGPPPRRAPAPGEHTVATLVDELGLRRRDVENAAGVR